MYSVVLICEGVPVDSGQQLALDVAEEFRHRPHHRNVLCMWTDGILTLTADNDFDETGEALADEFSDAIAANLSGPFGPIRIKSAGRIERNAV